ncbi:hypothetical protein EGW08_013061 [Elysia chlorotica]|uniref:Uncharacterized protein n=1 Tax=Elysia chlorotica TaxID=188477 RepID=A0A3S1B3S9_ELYCH|nr:hypothetical protein EGW08_013061 [Elysia chlorotica]
MSGTEILVSLPGLCVAELVLGPVRTTVSLHAAGRPSAKIPRPVTPRLLAFSYRQHVTGLHRLFLQCDLFKPNHQARSPSAATCAPSHTPSSTFIADVGTSTTSTTSTTSATASPTSQENREPSSKVVPVSGLDLTSSSPGADVTRTFLSADESQPRKYRAGVSNPVFLDDAASETVSKEDIEATQPSENQRCETLYENTLPEVCASPEGPISGSLEYQIDANQSLDQNHYQFQQGNFENLNSNEALQEDLENQHQRDTHEPSNQRHHYSWTHPQQQKILKGSNCCCNRPQSCLGDLGESQSTGTPINIPHTRTCEDPGNPKVIPPAAFTTSGSGTPSVDSRKKTARVSWSLDPADPSDLTWLENNNTKSLPCEVSPPASPISSRPSETLQPSGQLPFTADLHSPGHAHQHNKPRPHHNHSGKHNNNNTNHNNNQLHRQPQHPVPLENQHSGQIPPPDREHQYPYHNHHRGHSYPYHILPPQEPQAAATKTSPPPPPPPQSPDGSGGRSSPQAPPPHQAPPPSSSSPSALPAAPEPREAPGGVRQDAGRGHHRAGRKPSAHRARAGTGTTPLHQDLPADRQVQGRSRGRHQAVTRMCYPTRTERGNPDSIPGLLAQSVTSYGHRYRVK